MAEKSAEILRCEGPVRPGIDVLHDGVLLRWIKVGWLDDDAMDVGFAIAPFGDEALGQGPTGCEQGGGVGFLQFAYEAAVLATAQFGDGRVIGA